jgi:ubiquinone biosynthesis protein COQ9
MPAMDKDTETKLVAALWQVVAAHGWDGLSMTRLATASGVPMADIRRLCPSRLHLLKLHGRMMDVAVLETGVPDQPGTARDKVFDALMRRIDAMQPHRAGLLRFFEDVRCDPLLGLLLLAELPCSMAWMLEAAGISPGGLSGLLRVKGLTGVWLATMRAWAQDETQDLGPTMAALDRAIDQAERIARTIHLPPGDDTLA